MANGCCFCGSAHTRGGNPARRTTDSKTTETTEGAGSWQILARFLAVARPVQCENLRSNLTSSPSGGALAFQVQGETIPGPPGFTVAAGLSASHDSRTSSVGSQRWARKSQVCCPLQLWCWPWPSRLPPPSAKLPPKHLPRSAQPAPAAPVAPPEKHPEIHEALEALRNSKHHLEQAAHDFGGHRVEAIRAIEEAIHQLEICMQYED